MTSARATGCRLLECAGRTNFRPETPGTFNAPVATEPAVLMSRKCSVRIARYETKEDDPERDQLGAIESVEGTIYSLIHSA
jgi:ATP-dependent DNA helicase RecG